ncbi:hypothetical protein OKW46_002300 [Paraburkholderia sp. WSM4179]|nr:hypothetical protein [Paraburkholderia sp. WSM4179]
MPAWPQALAWRNFDHRDDTHPIQEALDGKNVEWLEKVTDEQYLGSGGQV